MRRVLVLGMATVLLGSCGGTPEHREVDPGRWTSRQLEYEPGYALVSGTTYLSVYSRSYSVTEHKTHPLTATVSIRNTSPVDSLFVESVDHFDTEGALVQTYIDRPIYLRPMETLEIIIPADDPAGGSGGNFQFEWSIRADSNEPLFEAVMISTSGQQGLSFATQGKRVR